jgi:hypothetical protein
MARMRLGQCRTTRNGQRYCRTKAGVRFVGRGFRGAGRALKGLSGKMRIGECRRTRAGVKYCKTRKGVRFRRG